MANVPVTPSEELLSTFDKHLPNMDCGYLRQILPYDHERYEIEGQCKYALFSLSGDIILSGESAEDIFNELKDKQCAIFWVN